MSEQWQIPRHVSVARPMYTAIVTPEGRAAQFGNFSRVHLCSLERGLWGGRTGLGARQVSGRAEAGVQSARSVIASHHRPSPTPNLTVLSIHSNTTPFTSTATTLSRDIYSARAQTSYTTRSYARSPTADSGWPSPPAVTASRNTTRCSSPLSRARKGHTAIHLQDAVDRLSA